MRRQGLCERQLVGVTIVQSIVLKDVILDSPAEGVQDSFEAIDFVLKLMDVGNA